MRKSCHSEWSNQRATIIDALNLLVHLQGWMHGLLAARMTGFAASRDWSLLAAMLPLGIVFGSIHALTPGHGKSVLASYLVGSPLSVLRSLVVASVQALTHVGMAVVIALVALPLVSHSLGGVGRAPSTELLSRLLLVAVGLWLLLRAWRGHKHEHAEGEGAMVGVIAGLVPCPLTLFAMVMALARGVHNDLDTPKAIHGRCAGRLGPTLWAWR
jgi:nickel/cobalt transporter (NicO) family protein